MGLQYYVTISFVTVTLKKRGFVLTFNHGLIVNKIIFHISAEIVSRKPCSTPLDVTGDNPYCNYVLIRGQCFEW